MNKEKTPFDGFNILNQDVIAPEFSEGTENTIVIPSAGEGIVSEVEPGSTQGEIIKPQIITDNGESNQKDDKEKVLEGVAPVVVEDEEDVTPLRVVTEFLAEKAIITVPEGFEDFSEDGLVTLVDNSIKKGIEDYKSSKPEVAKQLLEFLDNGGKVEDFINAYSEVSYSDITTDALTKDENLQKNIVIDLLSHQGYTQEEINQELEDYTDGGILANKAKRALAKLQVIQEDNKSNLVKLQASQKEAQIKQEQEFFVQLKGNIDAQEELLGFKLTPTEKAKFYEYITKVDRNTKKTALQQDMETIDNAQLKQAYMLFKKFDTSTVTKQAEKKATNTLLQRLGKAGSAKSNNYSSKSSAGGGDFSAFASIVEKYK